MTHDRHHPRHPHQRSYRQWLGREGEIRAARFLELRGYRIVARNVRADRVEIDLIARRRGLLIFVEVKTRRTRKSRRDGRRDCPHHVRHGHAAEAVDPRKQARLRRGAHAWLATHPLEARHTQARRFDVVTCLFGDVESADHGLRRDADENRAQNETTAPETARWSIEHWEAAF